MLIRSSGSLSKFEFLGKLEMLESFERIFGILHLSRLKKRQHVSSSPVYHQHFYMVVHSFVFSKKVFHSELLEFGLPYF